MTVLHVVAFHSASHVFLWLGDTAVMERNNVLFNTIITLVIITITNYIHDLDHSFSKPFGICHCAWLEEVMEKIRDVVSGIGQEPAGLCR